VRADNDLRREHFLALASGRAGVQPADAHAERREPAAELVPVLLG
jgi:hypothetical protein